MPNMKTVFHFLKFYIIALLGSVFIFLIGFLSKQYRNVIYSISASLGFSTKLKKHIPATPFSQLIQSHSIIQLTETIPKDGNITVQELAVICHLVKNQNPSCIFEIGTFDGRTALNMALNSTDKCEIYTLDLPKEMLNKSSLKTDLHEHKYIDKLQSGTRFLNHVLAPRIHQLFGDSATYDFSRFNFKCDLIFIDGSHAYEYVKNDSEKAMNMLAQDGIIIWHDYGVWNGVTRYLNEIYQDKLINKKIVAIEGTSLVVYI
jgi:predicted O-methyltransferase YrrM